MKKKIGLYIPVTIIMLLILSAEVLIFARGVSRELWNNSIQTMTEHTRQGANAVKIQLADDFAGLERIKAFVEDKKAAELDELLNLCRVVQPDVRLYFSNDKRQYYTEFMDDEVCHVLEETNLGQGVIDSHISSVTGEKVFNIFVKCSLADGSNACLVREYRTKEVADQFTLTFYDYTGFSYLVKCDGTIMVRSHHRNSNKTNASLFDMISSNENDAKMVERFKHSIHELRSGWAKFNYQGNGLVFCYEPFRSGSDWLLVSIVPEKVITAQAKSILGKTIIFSGAVVGIVLMIAAIFHGIKMRESKRHTRELQKALAAADTANKAKGQFLMSMSHDIRTPLNAIIGMTAIAQDNIDDKERAEECLEKVIISSRHLLSLVNDVLDMSQIEQGQMILKEEPLNILQLYQEVAELMGFLSQESEVSLEADQIQVKDEIVSGDPLRIRQILINIIGNAVKYTKPRGQIVLKLSQSEESREGYGTYRFCCTDTGIGIEPEFLEKIFMSFERNETTTVSGIAGIGVGLTITKSLLDLMGGSISVESVPGKGSVFTVEFHFRIQGEDLQEAYESMIKEEQQEEHEEISDYSHKRILLVEDVEINMEIAEAMLSATGVRIEKAYNGEEAVEMVRSHPGGYYDLIFMDIQMPVMDGYEATRQIRAMGREDGERIPIFALSANALAEDVENSEKAGMNGHLAKPIDMEMVKRVMQQNL